MNTGPTRRVHWSRVIHFADGLLEDDVYGTPRLRPVWNLLDDLIKVSGGTGEMFWRGGYRGMHADIPEDARLDPETKENLDTVLKEYDHKLRRWIQTEGGVTIKPLEASVSDPRGAFNVLLSLLAGTTGIPQRILIGSEMGRLASDQDRQNWSERIVERAERVAIPFALRPLIDRLMQIGALPTPRDGYRADPPELLAVSEETRARIVNLRSQAVERLGRSQDVQPHEWRPWVDLPAEPTPAPAGAASGDSE